MEEFDDGNAMGGDGCWPTNEGESVGGEWIFPVSLLALFRRVFPPPSPILSDESEGCIPSFADELSERVS